MGRPRQRWRRLLLQDPAVHLNMAVPRQWSFRLHRRWCSEWRSYRADEGREQARPLDSGWRQWRCCRPSFNWQDEASLGIHECWRTLTEHYSKALLPSPCLFVFLVSSWVPWCWRIHEQWDHTSRIAKIGWTANESLVILAKDGTYRLYPISSSGNIGSSIATNYIKPPSSSSSTTDYSQHSLSHDVRDATILDARIYENGMVILLSTYQFIHVKGWPENDTLSENTISASFISSQSGKSYHHLSQGNNAEDTGNGASARYGKGRVERFAETNWEHAPLSWCILTPEQSTSRQTEVLASYNESLINVDQLDIQDQVSLLSSISLVCTHLLQSYVAALLERALYTYSPLSIWSLHSFRNAHKQSIRRVSELQRDTFGIRPRFRSTNGWPT